MTKKPKALVLDSWSIVAYLEGNAAAEKVADLIADAHEQGIPLFMTVVNASEVWYIVARQTTSADADASMKHLRDLGIEFVNADWDLAHGAGYFKSKNRMSFADCFAAALAKLRRGHLVTGNPEFKQVEEEITISWLLGSS